MPGKISMEINKYDQSIIKIVSILQIGSCDWFPIQLIIQRHTHTYYVKIFTRFIKFSKIIFKNRLKS